MEYDEVARKIIEKQEETIGMIARQKAGQVDNISVDGDEISFEEEASRKDIEALMDQYKEIQGKGAVGIARKAVSGFDEEEIDIDLPGEIVPKDIKKDKLADAI